MSRAPILAFDFGTHHIGVAIGQWITQTASPLTILKAKQGQPNWDAVAVLVATWQPSLFVVGLHLHMNDDPSELSRLAEKFARRLSGRFNRPHQMMDERLSSIEAQILRPDKRVDDLSAALILESWFYQNERPRSSP